MCIDEDPTGELTRGALTPIVQEIKWAEKIFPYVVLGGLVLAAVVLALIFWL
jgi:nitrous oxidase accessory protein NosD